MENLGQINKSKNQNRVSLPTDQKLDQPTEKLLRQQYIKSQIKRHCIKNLKECLQIKKLKILQFILFGLFRDSINVSSYEKIWLSQKNINKQAKFEDIIKKVK